MTDSGGLATVLSMLSLKKVIPPSVVKRLPRYFSCVQSLNAKEIEWVSSSELADLLGLTSSTVRQDFSCFDFSGISKRGYNIVGLQKMLVEILGADMTWKVVVVGAGNMGRVLALHEEFVRCGFDVVAVFDADSEKHGTKVGELKVLPMSDLAMIVESQGVGMGIIAVPAAAAQDVADLLVDAGVKGILNMSMRNIITPNDVSVTASRIVASLQQLSHCVLFSCGKKKK